MDAKTCPTMWTGFSYSKKCIIHAFDEVRLLVNEAAEPYGEMVTAYDQRKLVTLKIACEKMADSAEEIRKRATQIENLSSHLARTIARIANRHGSES